MIHLVNIPGPRRLLEMWIVYDIDYNNNHNNCIFHHKKASSVVTISECPLYRSLFLQYCFSVFVSRSNPGTSCFYLFLAVLVLYVSRYKVSNVDDRSRSLNICGLRNNSSNSWSDIVEESDDDDDDPGQSFDQVQMKRKEMMRCVCSRYHNQTRRSFIKERFLISQEHNFLYCFNAKVASETWKAMFTKIRKTVKPEQHKHPLISFFTVRHPLERLVSAYEHKVLRNHAQYLHNVTFTQFLTKFVIREHEECPETNFCMNIHWMPFITSCSYCDAEYTFVQKMETFDWDQDHILKTLGLESLVKNKHRQDNRRKSNVSSDDLTRQYFSTISQPILDKLFNIYKYDFESFGYDYKVWIYLSGRNTLS